MPEASRSLSNFVRVLETVVGVVLLTAVFAMALASAHDSICNNRTPSTEPTMYIVQAAKLIGASCRVEYSEEPECSEPEASDRY
jgi:hypothetical protein